MSEKKKKLKIKFKCPFKTCLDHNINGLIAKIGNNEDKDQPMDNQLVQKDDSFVFETANGKVIKLSNDKINKIVIKLNQSFDENEVNVYSDNQLVPSLKQQDFETNKSNDNYLVKTEDNSLKSKTDETSQMSDSGSTATLKSSDNKRPLFEPYISGPNKKAYYN